MVLPFTLRGAGCAAVLAGLALLPPAYAAATPGRITLAQAIEIAVTRSPLVAAERSRLEEAEARRRAAGTYPFNPEVTVEAVRRSNDNSSTDHAVSLQQEVEIGRQRRSRIAGFDAELDAARSRQFRAERLLIAHVRVAFVEALRSRELLEVERANAALVISLSEAAQKRYDSGAVAQMEVNLAQAQVGRARKDLHLAEGGARIALALLAETVGLDPASPPEVEGALEAAPRPLPDIEQLLAGADDTRADLQSVRDAGRAARARIQLARREAIPNLGIGAVYAREDGSDRLLGGSLTLRIPLFNRNRGPVAEARAAHGRTAAEQAAATLQVRREVASAMARYQAAEAAGRAMQEQVLATLSDNLALLERSFTAGKSGWTDVLVFRREFVDARRDTIETLADSRLAAIELDLAAGLDMSRREP